MHTNASKLRAIVTAQHADGSWDLNSVAQLLHVDLTHLETANPMKKDDANATAADTSSATPKGGKKSGRKGKKDKTGKTEDATKTDGKEVIDESASNPADAAAATSSSSSSIAAETTGEPNKTEGDADSTAVSSTPALPALPALSDLWATIVLLSYLKHTYDAEKEFWTFVALKVAALLARAVPDETARNALLKKGHKYLSSAPGLLQAAP
jgi:hypothetical protein